MTNSTAHVFSFRYGVFRLLLVVMGMGPRASRMDLGPRELRVRMGWAFRATIPRDHVMGVEAQSGPVGGVGVHGFRGRWLVNGAATGLVRITIDPPVRARVVVPVNLSELTVSLEDPEGFMAALGRSE